MPDTLNKFCRNQFRDFLIGRLWHGVIHNINGPLQIISMNLELLKMLKDGDPDFPEQLWGRIEQIVDSIDKIQHITNNLSRRKEHPYSTWTPIVIEDVLNSELEFWISDLFFKHNVKKEIHLKESRNLVMTNLSLFLDLIDSIFAIQITLLKESEDTPHIFKLMEADEDQYKIVLLFDRTGPDFIKKDGTPDFENFKESDFLVLCYDVLYDSAKKLNCNITLEDKAIKVEVPRKASNTEA